VICFAALPQFFVFSYTEGQRDGEEDGDGEGDGDRETKGCTKE